MNMIQCIVQDYDCVMPAAGRSLRMGDWKLLMPFGGSTVVERSVANALGWCRRVILVVGHRSDELALLFRHEAAVAVVRNPEFTSGMFSSIQRGVREVSSRRFYVALADMPLVRPSIYRALAEWSDAPETGAVRPVYREADGHPVLFPATAIPEILKQSEESTMRELIAFWPLSRMSVDDPGVVCDIDTPGDYERARALLD